MEALQIHELDGLFTAVLLPAETGTFPIVITRSPYVDAYETMDEGSKIANCKT